MPMSPTPSAIRPTISSLSRSSRSTLTCGCAARNELSASGRNSVSALVFDRIRIWPDEAAGIGAEILPQPFGLAQDGAGMLQQRAAGLGRRHALAAADQQRGAERLLHVADARRGGRQRQICARSAPWVMLPASTTWRNRLEIGEVEPHALMQLFAHLRNGEGRLRQMPIARHISSAMLRCWRSLDRPANGSPQLRSIPAWQFEQTLRQAGTTRSRERAGRSATWREATRGGAAAFAASSIYRPMLTMMMSIVHRITGGGLYFGIAAAGLVAARRRLRPERLRQGAVASWTRSSAG